MIYEIKQILQDKSFIQNIEYLYEERRKSLFFRNGKIVLNNYSILHIRELWKDEQLLKYSYYWFTANNKLIIGWDNAPHHIEIDSSHHHKHSEKGIDPSTERNLPDVIKYIARQFLS